jgi:hypothetical protein
MILRLLLSLLIGSLLALPAQADTVVSWNFDNATPNVVDANASSTNFIAGAGLASPSISGTATASGWQAGSAAAALTASDFWQFTVTADAGYQLNLESLTFDYSRQSSNGPSNLQVYLDGALVGSPTSVAVPGSFSLDLSSFSGLAEAVFQIVAWGANTGTPGGTSAGNLSLDNLVLSGEVSQVNGDVGPPPTAEIPEPMSIAVWSLLGVAGLAYRWRRKRQAADAVVT